MKRLNNFRKNIYIKHQSNNFSMNNKSKQLMVNEICKVEKMFGIAPTRAE